MHVEYATFRRLTKFSNLEKLVRIPADYAATKPAPTPFDDTSDDLRCVLEESTNRIVLVSYHGLYQAQLLSNDLATHSLAMSKEMLYKAAHGARI